MEIIWLMIGYSVGVLTGVYIFKKINKEIGEREKNPTPSQADRERVLAYLKTREKITSDQVEKLLDVSDSTAQRYMQKMAGEGNVKKHGKTGRNVHYTLN